MGGHAAGQEASYLAVQAMVQWVVPHIAGVNAMSDELLVDGVRQANLAVYRRSQEVGADMGTTITAALVLDSKAYVVNVGDSRPTCIAPRSMATVWITSVPSWHRS